MKKFLSIVIATLLLFSVSVSTFAAESEPGSASCECVDITDEADFVLNGNIIARSTSLPTTYHKLAGKNYSADLQVVGKSWLYTNKYYHPNGDGKIYVDYDVTADTQTTIFYIGLYDLTNDKLVVEFDAGEVRTSGKDGSMYFYNLTQSHNYAVCFRAHPASLNGRAVIRH